jgi:Polyketide cyclase / dehydrase and lipid transport
MKSIVAIEINRPRRQVAMLFADPGNMTTWMHDLDRYEHVGGEQGAVGARYRMVPKPKTRQRAFISTVTFMHLPERLALRLESRRVDVLVNTTFTALAKDRTKLVSEEKFIFPGFFRWLFSLFVRNRIRRHHRVHIEAFKRFAEAARSDATPPA